MIVLRFILIIITIYILIFNILYGDMKQGWKLELLFMLYLMYLVIK